MNNLWIAVRKGYQHFAQVVDNTYHNVLPKLIFLIIILTLVSTDVAQATSREAILDRLLNGREFDFVNWEFTAALTKIGHELTAPQTGVTDGDQVELVKSYIRRVGNFEKLEGQIEEIYTDPNEKDPAGASASLRVQRDQLRKEIDAYQNVAEAIMQEQVESILREEGFAIGGQLMPPLRFRFTPLPYVLIISRRDKIERTDQRELTTGLTVDEFDRIEKQVEKQLNVSSLVTPIGGLGAYPTMLPETSSLKYTLDTAAHEWTHNYLLFSPVGIRYNEDPVARVINETTAVIVQQEIGRRVLERYYPELLPPPASLVNVTPKPKTVQPANQPPPFNFNAAMRETRMRADELLAADKIEEAEAYMEDRRSIFVKNGYGIRRLNQAYFAFHGAYNAEPGGSPEAGKDPIGPAVQALRQNSASLGDFVRKVAIVQTLDDVQRLAEPTSTTP